MIRAGELRHTVVIQRRRTERDVVGEPVNEWVEFATRRAGIKRSSGREVFASEQRQGRVPTVFQLRFLSGVLPSMRLLLLPGEQLFDIVSAVDPDGRRAELVITAEERVGEAP